jgi:acetolactate synthase small subunit
MNALARLEACAKTHVFLIEAVDEPDALLRVLGPLAVRQVHINGLEMRRIGAGLTLRIEVAGLADGDAEHLTRRLRGLPVVIAVSLGWSSA